MKNWQMLPNVCVFRAVFILKRSQPFILCSSVRCWQLSKGNSKLIHLGCSISLIFLSHTPLLIFSGEVRYSILFCSFEGLDMHVSTKKMTYSRVPCWRACRRRCCRRPTSIPTTPRPAATASTEDATWFEPA